MLHTLSQGIVAKVIALDEYYAARACANYGAASAQKLPTFGTILRLAAVSERDRLPAKNHKENHIFEVCMHLLQTQFKLNIQIRGVAFQFDGTKLTVYYQSATRVDFRPFVSELSGIFNVRVWMQKVSQTAPLMAASADVAQALASGFCTV